MNDARDTHDDTAGLETFAESDDHPKQDVQRAYAAKDTDDAPDDRKLNLGERGSNEPAQS